MRALYTVSSTTSTVSYAGNGVTTSFSVTYEFGAATDLTVWAVDAATGVATLKVLTTDYTVTGGAGSTGAVTAVVAPPTGTTWVIERNTPPVQEVGYVQNDGFPAEANEDGLDNGVLLAQQAIRRARQSPRLPATFQGVSTIWLPLPVAGKYLVGRADAAGWEQRDLPVTGGPFDAGNVLWVNTGTGAFQRSVQDRLRETVSVKDFGAVGDGVTDDSAAFTAALAASSREVFVPAGTYAIKSVVIATTATCTGIRGEHGSVLVPATGATSTTTLITCSKLVNFYFRNLVVLGPISTDPVVSPALSCGFRFSTTSAGGDAFTGDGWEVSNCRFTGGQNGVVTNGRCKNSLFADNFFTNTWKEALQVGFPSNTNITRNTFIDGGYATGGSQPAGAIRIGGTGSAFACRLVAITHNKFSNYCVNAGQSAIDCFTTDLSNVDVSNNQITAMNGGIEFKTQPGTGVAADERYAVLTCRDNTFSMLASATSCITVFHAAENPPTKTKNVLIEGNHCSADSRPTGTLYGIILDGYANTSIKGNHFTNVSYGVDISADGVAGDKAYDVDVTDNTFDTFSPCISSATDTTNRLTISNNVLRSRASTAINMQAVLVNLTIENNFIHGVSATGIDIRNVTKGRVLRNTILGGINPIYFLGTTPTDILVEFNRLKATWDAIPATGGSVTDAGTGMTNGTRIFTVTSGTGTVPCVFSCVVSGGSITGPVVIIEPGSYSTFPSTPTVTVDQGSLSTAAFTLTSPTAAGAVRVDTGTGLIVRNNSIDVAVGQRGTYGAGIAGCVASNNQRNMVTGDPTATYAAGVGDVFPHSAPVAGGAKEYYCVTAGNAGAAVFNAIMLRGLTVGAATQNTDKTTAVTVNAMQGDITLNNANLVAGATVTFVLNNSFIANNDYVAIQHESAGTGGVYTIHATATGGGQASIVVRNNDAADHAEAILLRFYVLKVPV